MRLQIFLIVAYMALTHLAVVLRQDQLALVAILILLVMALVEPFRRGARWPYLIIAAALIGIICLATASWARIVLLLPPVIVNGGLAWAFGHTLIGDRTPLIARFVRLMHGPDDVVDPAVWVYARSVTLCWTALFCFNAIVCLLLAVVARPGGVLALAGVHSPLQVPTIVWTLYADVGCYALTGLMFLVEYHVRKRRFPWQPYRSFLDFMRKAAAVSPAVMHGLGASKGPGEGTGG